VPHCSAVMPAVKGHALSIKDSHAKPAQDGSSTKGAEASRSTTPGNPKSPGNDRSGRFGQVFQCARFPGVAEKKVKVTAESPLEAILEEAAIQKSLKHPNIVECFGHRTEGEFVFIKMEWMHEDLHNIIVDKRVTRSFARRVTKFVGRGLNFIHKSDYVHLDIKPENIMVQEVGNRLEVKIADFGLASKLPVDDSKRLGCTPQYSAPEVRNRRHDVTTKADSWSLGAVAYVMFVQDRFLKWFDFSAVDTDYIAYATKYMLRQTFRTKRRPVVETPPEAVHFMERMLVARPSDRDSCEAALNCAWLQAE